MSKTRPIARLALEDGTVFTGTAFGACSDPVTSPGEVVFNTAMCGYQEAITDPSYAGQILTMTAPMMGNYGVGDEDVESARPQIAGFVVRELSRLRSNYRGTEDLSQWLADHGVLGIEGIDTRALVRRLRQQGAMRAVLTCDACPSDDDLIDLARRGENMTGRNLARLVSPAESGVWREGLGAWAMGPAPAEGTITQPLRVLAIDCGAKRNIYRNLTQRGCEVTFAPHDINADEIRRAGPDGLFVSNGPGDPEAVGETIETLRHVAGQIPTFGICLGHQLLALALGAETFKLKFGHRGANQPVRNLLTGRVEITSQNHGFCVAGESLTRVEGEITHIHLNDGTAAGFRHCSKPIFAVQYHPEASPGPHDSAYLFDCFVWMMRSKRPIDAKAMREAQIGQPAASTI